MKINDFIRSFIPIVEIFTSISGEGISAGEVVTFVRTAGCNLRCNYCDTTYSYAENGDGIEMLSPMEIVYKLNELKATKVLCTGGEPLEPYKIKRLLPIYLASKGFEVRIETNGSCEVYSEEELGLFETDKILKINYVLDVKCPGSGMSKYNIFKENYEKLKIGDELKFVVSNKFDMDYSLGIIEEYKEILAKNKVVINFSPVFNSIDTKEIVDMLVLNEPYFNKEGLKARLSLQIHKVIWTPETRGV